MLGCHTKIHKLTSAKSTAIQFSQSVSGKRGGQYTVQSKIYNLLNQSNETITVNIMYNKRFIKQNQPTMCIDGGMIQLYMGNQGRIMTCWVPMKLWGPLTL